MFEDLGKTKAILRSKFKYFEKWEKMEIKDLFIIQPDYIHEDSESEIEDYVQPSVNLKELLDSVFSDPFLRIYDSFYLERYLKFELNWVEYLNGKID